MNWSSFDYKTNKKEWKKEAETCLDYALNKIQNEYRNVRINKIIKAKILNDYYYYCAIFDNSYVKGNMDSFEKAACLMTAIHRNKILFYGDNQVKDIGTLMFSRKTIDDLNYKNGLELRAELALDAALKMCENPICYVGEKWNEPKQLEHFNLEQFTTDYEDEWKKIKYELFITGYYSEGKYSETLSKYLMLKYLYKYVNSKINEKTEEVKKEKNRIVLKRAPEEGYEITDEEMEILNRLNGTKKDEFEKLYLSSEDYDRIYQNVVGDVLEGANKTEENKDSVVYPGIIEDDPKYENWSGFCNIDAFSKQGCQKFPKVTGRVRHKIIEHELNEGSKLIELAEGLKRTREELVELCESNPEQAKELAIEALIRTGVIESSDDVVKGKAFIKERKDK